jgi:hypothetical protein
MIIKFYLKLLLLQKFTLDRLTRGSGSFGPDALRPYMYPALCAPKEIHFTNYKHNWGSVPGNNYTHKNLPENEN